MRSLSIKKDNLSKKRVLLNMLVILTVLYIMFLISGNNVEVFATTEVDTQAKFVESFNNLAGLLNKIANFMLGVSLLSGFGTVIYHLIKLGGAGSNPQARAKILQDMMTTGICLALLGSLNFAVSLVTMWFFV